MDKATAGTGWIWIREGFALFRKQPGELTTLVLFYIFLMLAFKLVPVIGGIVGIILTPVFLIGFMQACANVEQEIRVHPRVLLTGFRSAAFKPMLKLGVLYLIAAILAVAAFGLVDDGLFLKIMNGEIKPDQQVIENSNMGSAMLSAFAVYLPLTMALWFVAPLLAWQKIGLGKAIFYNSFVVWRKAKCFLVYIFSWCFIVVTGLVLTGIVSIPLTALLGKNLAAGIATLALLIVLYAVFYCSFYRSYVQLFGQTEIPENSQEQPVQS